MTKGFDFAFNDTAIRLQSVNDDGIKAEHPPLTKREYFAAMAMSGLLANFQLHGHYGNSNSFPMVEDMAIQQADALINALNK